MTDSASTDLVLNNKRKRHNPVDLNSTEVKLTLSTLNDFGGILVLVNHATRRHVYECVLNTSFQYQQGLMKDMMFNVFMDWIPSLHTRLHVFVPTFKLESGPNSEKPLAPRFVFHDRHGGPASDVEHPPLLICFYDQDEQSAEADATKTTDKYFPDTYPHSDIQCQVHAGSDVQRKDKNHAFAN